MQLFSHFQKKTHGLKISLIFIIILITNIQRGTSQVHEIGLFFGRSGLHLSELYNRLEFDLSLGSEENNTILSNDEVIGFLYRYNLNNSFSFSASASYFEFKTSPLSKINLVIENPKKSYEINGRLEYWLESRSLLDWYIPQFRPYIFVGGGILINAPYSFDQFGWIERELPILSSGLGLSINPTRWLNFGVEFGARFILVAKSGDFFGKFYNYVERDGNTIDGNNWYYIFGVSATISFKEFPLFR